MNIARMNPHLQSLSIALASLTFGAFAFAAAPVANEELSALANDVNLSAWVQVAASPDFATIEEGWVAVYSPKDAVGMARDWDLQLAQARSLATRATQPRQKRWLQLFIKAGEAVARKDSVRFIASVRSLGREIAAPGGTLAVNANFLGAK